MKIKLKKDHLGKKAGETIDVENGNYDHWFDLGDPVDDKGKKLSKDKVKADHEARKKGLIP